MPERLLKLALTGEFQDGKSTLINALCGVRCADTGYGLPTTDEVQEYRIPRTNILLLDTPGFNSTREGDSERARKGLEMADVCMYMLSNKQFTGEMFRELKEALKLPHGGYKLFIPIINDRDRNNDNICSESVAVMKSVGLRPILFGDEIPVIHARAWEKGKGKRTDYALGEKRIKFLLGVEPYREVSPLEHIYKLHKLIHSV